MKRWTMLICCIVAFPCSVLAQETAGADKMLAEFNAIKLPILDDSRKDDPAYMEEFIAQSKAVNMRRARAAGDFYSKFPQHPQAMKVMENRWQILSSDGHADVVLNETGKMLSEGPQGSRRVDILYGRAAALIAQISTKGQFGAASPAVDEFIQAAPKDERGAVFLFQLLNRDNDPARMTRTRQRIADQYADTHSGEVARGQIHRADAIGKPFELSFTDAISGKPVSVQKDLKGKIVVVDFWATWCEPCVAEMPELKQIYAQYREKGVEFVGVSLDRPGPGLDALKNYIKKNEIAWPQYYQGNGWDSEFSSNWGINEIPTTFLIDAEGKLYSTEARGKLAIMIRQLLHG